MKSEILVLVCIYLVAVHSHSPITFPSKTCEKQDGGWSEYLRWGPCSKTCGNGYQTRHRYCDNPIPKYRGAKCYGPSKQTRQCNLGSCPSVVPVKTVYTKCSRKCGGGYREKRQECEFPQDAHKSCFICNPNGKVVRERCNTHSCPTNPPTYQPTYPSTQRPKVVVVKSCNECQRKAEATNGVGLACRVNRSACHGKNGGIRDMYAANGWFFLHCSADGPWCKPCATRGLVYNERCGQCEASRHGKCTGPGIWRTQQEWDELEDDLESDDY